MEWISMLFFSDNKTQNFYSLTIAATFLFAILTPYVNYLLGKGSGIFTLQMEAFCIIENRLCAAGKIVLPPDDIRFDELCRGIPWVGLFLFVLLGYVTYIAKGITELFIKRWEYRHGQLKNYQRTILWNILMSMISINAVALLAYVASCTFSYVQYTWKTVWWPVSIKFGLIMTIIAGIVEYRKFHKDTVVDRWVEKLLK